MGYIMYLCQMGHLVHMGYDVYIMIYGLYNVFVSMGHLMCVGHLVLLMQVIISGMCGSSGRNISVVPRSYVDFGHTVSHDPVTY